jgi:hypothetical protein
MRDEAVALVKGLLGCAERRREDDRGGAADAADDRTALKNVKNIVAVGSGKGVWGNPP